MHTHIKYRYIYICIFIILLLVHWAGTPNIASTQDKSPLRGVEVIRPIGSWSWGHQVRGHGDIKLVIMVVVGKIKLWSWGHHIRGHGVIKSVMLRRCLKQTQ